MQIKPDEITSILKSRIEGLDEGGADLSEVGTVLSIADGISRVLVVTPDGDVLARLDGAMAFWSP